MQETKAEAAGQGAGPKPTIFVTEGDHDNEEPPGQAGALLTPRTRALARARKLTSTRPWSEWRATLWLRDGVADPYALLLAAMGKAARGVLGVLSLTVCRTRGLR